MEEKKGLIFKKWPWNSLLRDNHGFSSFSSRTATVQSEGKNAQNSIVCKRSKIHTWKSPKKVWKFKELGTHVELKKMVISTLGSYDFRDFFQTINLQSDLGFVQGKNRSLYFSYLYWHANPYVMELIPIYGYITCRWSTFAPDIRLMFLFYSHFRRAPN